MTIRDQDHVPLPSPPDYYAFAARKKQKKNGIPPNALSKDTRNLFPLRMPVLISFFHAKRLKCSMILKKLSKRSCAWSNTAGPLSSSRPILKIRSHASTRCGTIEFCNARYLLREEL